MLHRRVSVVTCTRNRRWIHVGCRLRVGNDAALIFPFLRRRRRRCRLPSPQVFSILLPPLTRRDGSLIEGSLLSIGLLPPLLSLSPSEQVLIVVIPPRHPPAATPQPRPLLISPKCIIRRVVCPSPSAFSLLRLALRVYLFVCVIEASCPFLIESFFLPPSRRRLPSDSTPS